MLAGCGGLAPERLVTELQPQSADGCAQVSCRVAPPHGSRARVRDAAARALPPLPGGYKVGEKVFFVGQGQTFADGDKVVHSQQGEVAGVMSGHTTARGHAWSPLAVRFPGNKGFVGLRVAEVRRLRAASAPPPRRLRAASAPPPRRLRAASAPPPSAANLGVRPTHATLCPHAEGHP